MKRTTTFSVLLAALLIIGSGAAVAQADATTASEATSPVYIMDGPVETADISTTPVGINVGFEEPPAFGLEEPVQDASPVDVPVGITADEDPWFLQ